MADELESFSALTDAEKDAIWGAGAYGASAWGTDLTKETGTTYQGNSTVKIVDDGTLHSGFAYRDKIPVGNNTVMRLWTAINVPACLTNSIMWGMLRYDTAGALVDAIATDTDAEDYDDAAWHVLQAALAIGGNAYVRPFVSIEGSITVYVGMLDAAPMPTAFWAYLDADTDYNNTNTIVFDKCDGMQSTYNFGGAYNAATGIYTALVSGLHSFVAFASVQAADLDTGEIFRIWIFKNAQGLAQGTTARATTDNEGGSSLAATGPVWLDAGDQISVRITETHAGAVTVLGDIVNVPYAYFGGAVIR